MMEQQQGGAPISADVPIAAPHSLGIESPDTAENQKMIALFGVSIDPGD